MIRLEERFTRNPDIVHRKVNDESILVPLRIREGRGWGFYFLEGVGGRIWELLNGRKECQKIVQEIAREFGVRKERVEKEILAFLEELKKEGLIQRPS